MLQEKIICTLTLLAVVIIASLVIYKNSTEKATTIPLQSDSPKIETFTVTTVPTTTTPAPTTTMFDVPTDVKAYLDSRYNEILSSQYENLKRQQKLDELTDRLNSLNTELQKHVNHNLTYKASGELNFY